MAIKHEKRLNKQASLLRVGFLLLYYKNTTKFQTDPLPLDWTFVCPPNIINEGPTGSYSTNANYPPELNNYKINAGDLAMFILNELQKNEYVKQRVGISN